MITIDWGTFVINVPKTDMTLVQSTPIEIRELDLNNFRLTLKGIEDSAEGIGFQKTHNHYSPVTVGGVTLARVVELLDPYTVTFEDGQYAVNLVGANSNVADRVNLNQVSVRAANSAGLIQTKEIEYSSFQNKVWVDATSGVVGTLYPRGTPLMPVNNIPDMRLIALYRGLETIYLCSDYTFGAGDNITGFTIEGRNPKKTYICILPDAEASDCEILNATVSGVLDGGSRICGCDVGNLLYVNGEIHDSVLMGTITLDGDQPTLIIECASDTGDVGTTFDMGGGGQDLTVRSFTGNLTIRNLDDSQSLASIDMDSGTVTIEPTVSAGMVTIRGICEVIDNHTGTAVIDLTGVINTVNLADGVWDHSEVDVLEEKLSDIQLAASGIQTDTTELLSRLTATRALLLDDIPDIEVTLDLLRKIQTNRLEFAEGTTDNWKLYDDDNITLLLQWSVTGKMNEAIEIPLGAAVKRGKAH